MESTIFLGGPHKKSATSHMRYGKQAVVPTEQERLADFVRRIINEKKLRYRQIAERSGGRSGGGISPSTISDIISGRTKEIKSGTIAALARGLEVTEAELWAAIRGQSIDDEMRRQEEHMQIISMYEDIPRQCQQDVLDLLQVLQHNHSISARKEKRAAVRIAAAQINDSHNNSSEYKTGSISHTAKATFEGVEKPRTKAAAHVKKRRANNE
jgi:transcriptional regulator with XRE-family HTH domain